MVIEGFLITKTLFFLLLCFASVFSFDEGKTVCLLCLPVVIAECLVMAQSESCVL